MNKNKIIKGAISLVCIFFFIITSIKNVHAENFSFYTRAMRDSLGNIRFKYSINGNVGNFVKYIRQLDNETVYCIEPTKEVLDYTQGSYQSTLDDNSIIDISKLSKETLKKLKQISYYGYGYGNHTDDSWYAATQLEIWNTVMPGCCKIFSGDSKLVENNINEIRNLVNGINLLPSFNLSTKNQVVDSTVEYIDSNNVINQYVVSSCENCDATIQGNKLIVKGIKEGNAKVNLERKIANKHISSILYYSGNSQKLMKFGSPEPLTATLNLRMINGKIKIQKIDKDTKKTIPQGEGTFDGAEYTVYDYNKKNIVGTIITNESGYGELSLGAGKYTIKETKSTKKGYLISNEEFIVEITNDNVEELIYANEQIIKGKVELTKLYGDNELGFLKEELAEFAVYNFKNELVKVFTTNENGEAMIELPFGKYKIVQTKGKKNFSFIDDIVVDVTENGKIYSFVAKDLSYPRLSIEKKDKDNEKPIGNVTMEIYKYNDNNKQYELVYRGVTSKDGKINLKDLELGNYYFIETKAEGYVLDTRKHYFEINEYGKTYKLELYNQKIRSNLKISKKDSLTENLLKDAVIEIYNAKNNKLVFSGTTNEDGEIFIKDLKYGEYYILEKEAPEGYVLDTTKYYISILENNKTYYFELKNKKITGTLEFTKSDIVTGDPLPNTLIEIYNEQDELIFSGKTNDDGKIIIEELSYGKYYILEKEAPEGYQVNDEKLWLEILEDGEIVKSEMKDEKIVVVVPNTLKNNYVRLCINALITVGAVIVVYGIIKNKKTKK